MKKVFISTMGCAVSHKEGQQIKDYFTSNGWEMAKSPSKAEAIVLNLCALSKTREEYHLEYIRNVQKIKNKAAKLIIVGCIAKISQKEVEALQPDACIPPTDWHKLDEILKFNPEFSEINERGVVQKNPIFIQLKAVLLNSPVRQLWDLSKSFLSIYGILYKHVKMPYEHKLSSDAYTITIAKGCLNKCSYCAIRLARGKLQSMPSQEVIRRVHEAIDLGYKRIHLLGTNPCQFGLDKKDEIDFFELLTRITAIPSDCKLVLPDFDPNLFVKNFDRMRKILATKKILEITFSLQSGSPKIIKAMNRFYNIERYKQYVKEIQKIDPNTRLNAHIMIGFPGETVREFNETFDMIKELKFDKILLFDYGDRPGTPSSDLPGHLTPAEMKRRMDMLNRYLFFSFAKSWFRSRKARIAA